ncbi:odorant receptor 30a-like [Diorhabda sublineata]|uniref:odorant receptor 30a-like n=1 Tax=Diorhabda sublineata TaxID=1163346 RepID=UPI0024E0D840|nr:odorant receptor 30a-like [Diorhabda sublineata]
MACMILGCDFLFVAISSCIICQYKILHNTFLKFNTPEMSEVNEKLRFLADDKLDFNYKNENKEAFVRCVRHHQLLLSVTKKWNNLFGWIAMCLITSAIIAKNATLSQQVMRLALTIIVLSQLLEYCAIGNELYYQAGLLPEHIFQANWYDLHSCELKKDFMFLLHHSQNVPYLNAYNLYNIDMNFYIKVLKLMFSIYTFFSKMEFKNE